MLHYHTPDSVAKLFPKVLFHLPRVEKKLYLTFDDGPNPEITLWVLNQLELYNAKATFFCVGESLKNNISFVNTFIGKGHQIGNHTYNHLNGWKTDSALYYKNVRKSQKIYQSNIFRPPYGKITKRQTTKISNEMKVVLWDVLTGDFNNKLSPEYCFRHILKYTTNGSILVFHDSIKAKQNLRKLLPQVLEYYSKNGFTFEVLPLFKKHQDE